MAKHILSVSYDEPLLKTRELLLRRQGYLVTSCLGFTAAAEQCIENEFDLFILGHSIPQKDKMQLIQAFRTNCPGPVLALRRYSDAPLPCADAHVFPDDIEGLLSTVDSMLSNHDKAEPPNQINRKRAMGTEC